MYPIDEAAQNATLDALLSGDFSGLPSGWELALYTDDPTNGGVELDSDGGYARVPLGADLTDWPAAADGSKTSVIVTFAAATDAWSDTATFWVLVSADDSTTRWYYGLLAEPVIVLEAGTAVAVQCSTYWNTEGD